MATPHWNALKYSANFGSGAERDALFASLKPQFPDQAPLPPALSRKPEDAEARLKTLETATGRLAALRGESARPAASEFSGNIENYIGMAQVPVGVIGPLRVRGTRANGDYLVPLATSEGALVASYGRGAWLAGLAGGVTCVSLAAGVQRAPGFVFEGVAEAAEFAAYSVGMMDKLSEAVATRSSHARLEQVSPHVEGNQVHLIFSFNTGEAAGQNMVTLCTEAAVQSLLKGSPVAPKRWCLEANMSGDKKATVQSLLGVRGRKVSAEIRVPAALLQHALHSSAEQMADYWRMSFTGGAQTGSVGVSGHVANALAALFLATGQDIACVSEASVGVTRLEAETNGSLYACVTLPNLIVGSVGGGTRLPTASECLRLMNCEGEHGADRLAEICAATALCGELSIIGALCAHEFASAHARLGRKP